MDDAILFARRRELMANVVAMAVCDLIKWKLISKRFPADEEGMPPETYYHQNTKQYIVQASKKKFPYTVKNGPSREKVFRTPSEYVKFLEDKARCNLKTSYGKVRYDGESAYSFLSNDERLNGYTDYTSAYLMGMVDKKVEMIERGESDEETFNFVGHRAGF